MTNEKQGQAKQGPRKKSGNRNRNRNRNRSQNQDNRPNNSKSAKGQGPNKNTKKKASGNRRPNNRRPNNRRRRSGAKLTGLDMITTKYNNLLEQYLVARKKYHDLFFRADPNQKAKLERVYNNAMQRFFEFKENLKPEDREIFEAHYNGLKKDLDYSTINEINPVAEAVSFELSEQPHFLESQQECNYSDDTEESVGTMDDYKAYKGL